MTLVPLDIAELRMGFGTLWIVLRELFELGSRLLFFSGAVHDLRQYEPGVERGDRVRLGLLDGLCEFDRKQDTLKQAAAQVSL